MFIERNSIKLGGFWIFVVLSETEAVPFVSISHRALRTSGVLTLLLVAGWDPLAKSLFSIRVWYDDQIALSMWDTLRGDVLNSDPMEQLSLLHTCPTSCFLVLPIQSDWPYGGSLPFVFFYSIMIESLYMFDWSLKYYIFKCKFNR